MPHKRKMQPQVDLEDYFHHFRMNTIGINHCFQSPYGRKRILYADWTATGRLYRPIERKLLNDAGPFCANTHTDCNVTGSAMNSLYEDARQIIKQHVNSDKHDMLILDGAGTTGVVNKLQRILGLRVPELVKSKLSISEEERPVIFVTHMEHHSNQISWKETIGDVIVLEPAPDGAIDVAQLSRLLEKYNQRKVKIGSFTACSNVTGVMTPYYQLARIMHEHGGICFVDFAAAAPYVEINMHPKSPLEKLDGIFFSPHKFLGGPGSCGVLIFDSRLHTSGPPDKPGGGTVAWSNPWGEYKYLTDMEAREDGGTPGILQTLKAALCIRLKETMGTENIIKREQQLTQILLSELRSIPKLHLLEAGAKERLGIISFDIEHTHYNLIVKILSDRFGIQVRGGCSCAGTYGHYLLEIDQNASKQMTDKIDQGDLSARAGWVRVSLHPTMTVEEVYQIAGAINMTADKIKDWQNDYVYHPRSNSFTHKSHCKQFTKKDFFVM